MTTSIFVSLILFAASWFAFGRWRSRQRLRSRAAIAEAGLYPGRFAEALAHALIADRGYLRSDTRILESRGPGLVIERDGAAGRLIVCPALGFGSSGDLSAIRFLAARYPGARRTTLVVVGGTSDFGREALRAAAPLPTLHLADDGRVLEGRRWLKPAAPRLIIENALDRMARDLREGELPSLDFEVAKSLAVPDFSSDRAAAPLPRGPVTTALTVAIVACFAAEIAFTRDALGGSGETISVVYRMGAIHGDTVWKGEPERLLAAPFLHFGLLHIAMNGWAQWSLGLPLEYLVGSGPFLGLWVASALGASLTSLFFNEGAVAAGASGAVFGLLGAFTTFVFLRRDVLPQPVPRSLRNGVLMTLLLNLGISFVPGIDTAAHAGGFVTGALAGLLLSRSYEPASPLVTRRLRGFVVLLGLLGVGVSSWRGKPWQASTPPSVLNDHRVGNLLLPAPLGFEWAERATKDLTVVELDGTPRYPFAVTYKVSAPQADDDQAARLLSSLRSREPVSGPDDWIALSRLGTEGRRAIEIVVVTPASCRAEAERLSAELAQRIRSVP